MGLPDEEELAQRDVCESPLPPLGVIGVPGLVKHSLSCSFAQDWLACYALSKDISLQASVLLPLRCLETSLP